MKIQTVYTAPKVPFDLDGRIIYSGGNNELIHLTLKPGELLPEHTNPFDVLMFVVEGNGLFRSEGIATEIVPDMSVFIESGLLRGIQNTGKNNLRLLVYKMLNQM